MQIVCEMARIHDEAKLCNGPSPYLVVYMYNMLSMVIYTWHTIESHKDNYVGQCNDSCQQSRMKRFPEQRNSKQRKINLN